MGAYKEIKNSIVRGYKDRSDEYTQRMLLWRSQPPLIRVDKPTNIPRARELGYKAKQGIIVARVKVIGGAKKRKHFDGGRKPSKSGRFYTRAKSMQSIAEERVARKFSNYEVLNSYFVGKSGSDSFYEVIMLNPSDASISNDSTYVNAASKRGRSFRGLTRTGRKHRGIA